MGTENNAVSVWYSLANLNKKFADFIWSRIAHRIRQVDRCSPYVDHTLNDSAEEIKFSTRRIFSRKLNVVRVLTCELDTIDSCFETLVL